MKAAQITKYSKKITAKVNDIPIPEIGYNEIIWVIIGSCGNIKYKDILIGE